MAFFEDAFDVPPKIDETKYKMLLKNGASESLAREMARTKGQFVDLENIPPFDERRYLQH